MWMITLLCYYYEFLLIYSKMIWEFPSCNMLPVPYVKSNYILPYIHICYVYTAKPLCYLFNFSLYTCHSIMCRLKYCQKKDSLPLLLFTHLILLKEGWYKQKFVCVHTHGAWASLWAITTRHGCSHFNCFL